MGSCCAGSSTLTIEGSRMARFDASYDADRDLKITVPKIFAEMDANGDGEMNYKEFCQGFSFSETPLTKKLFDAFDADGSGQISLVEFIAGLRNWSRYNYEEKMKFTYKIY